MSYQLSKLVPDYKLTSDGRKFLTDLLKKLDAKLSRMNKTNFQDSVEKSLGPQIANAYGSSAKSNASYAGNYKNATEAKEGLGLKFTIHKHSRGDLTNAIYCTTFLENVAVDILNDAAGERVNNKIGKAQMILAIAFDKKDTAENTMKDMNARQLLAYKLGFVAPKPTSKQLAMPKYTDYGLQCILASKGFQAVKKKLDKDGNNEGDSGLSYEECMTVLLFRKRSIGCAKPYQYRNVLTGRCEGKRPKGSARKSKRKSKCARYGKLKSRTSTGRVCKKKPGRKSRR